MRKKKNCLIHAIKALILLLALSSPSSLYSAIGDVFTAKTAEGVEMTFRVINEVNKTCQVGNGDNQCFSDETTQITIPDVVKGYSVSRIGNSAFFGCSALSSITIPNSVTSIGEGAFYYCSGLTSITIPSSVTSIGDYAFYGCHYLTSITIPSSVTSIGDYVFSSCSSLASITIPNGVTSIGDHAFWCSGLTSITIPSSVTSISNSAFHRCPGLTSIIVQEGNMVYDSRNNCNAIIETASNTLISGCKNTTIPNSVKIIGESAFEGCSGLTSITIPNSVTSIGDYVFSGCSSLASITIPSSVMSIGDYAFGGCSSLASITIPSSVTSIGKFAFENCYGLTSINISNSVMSIGDHAFSGCTALASITIPNSVTSIGEGAFYNCNGLTSITIPNSVTSIGDYAFANCTALASITIPNSVTSIGERAFLYCSGLTAITISNGVTSIGEHAFYGCSDLTSITIPSSVTSIGNSIFGNCRALTYILVQEGNTVYDSRNNCNAIIETASNTLISGCKNTTIPNSVTSIGKFAFENCYGLTSITIPNNVTSIGEGAFYNCNGLTSITIPNSVTSIGDYAFYYCSGLTSINISNSVTSIGNDAFACCRSLTSITIPNSVTSIGNYAFNRCESLTSFTIPRYVSNIGPYAFGNCPNLKNVYSEVLSPPSISFDTFGPATYSSAPLYVRYGTKEQYQIATGWKEFKDIVEMPKEFNLGDTFMEPTSENVMVTYKVIDEENMMCQVGDDNAAVSPLSSGIVTIPEMVRGYEVTTIGNMAFSGCSTLLYVSFPSTIKNFGNQLFDGCNSLAAVQWNLNNKMPDSFLETVNNPNLLLYVNNKNYAPVNVQNTVVSDEAENIILKDSKDGNDFYCPKEFTAKNIEYTHNYSMTSGYRTCQGWETIALPFDVSSISYGDKDLVPISTWKYGDTQIPFWLYEQTADGWKAASAIKANTPYIICMPNNLEHYDDEYNIKGDVTFRGENVKVFASDKVTATSYNGKTFVPNFQNQAVNSSIYALNVNNNLEVYEVAANLPGSIFIRNLRTVHPFEAYMTYEGGSAREFFPIFEDGLPTGIDAVQRSLGIMNMDESNRNNVYNLKGLRVMQPSKGLYIVNGRKVVVK